MVAHYRLLIRFHGDSVTIHILVIHDLELSHSQNLQGQHHSSTHNKTQQWKEHCTSFQIFLCFTVKVVFFPGSYFCDYTSSSQFAGYNFRRNDLHIPALFTGSISHGHIRSAKTVTNRSTQKKNLFRKSFVTYENFHLVATSVLWFMSRVGCIYIVDLYTVLPLTKNWPKGPTTFSDFWQSRKLSGPTVITLF